MQLSAKLATTAKKLSTNNASNNNKVRGKQIRMQQTTPATTTTTLTSAHKQNKPKTFTNFKFNDYQQKQQQPQMQHCRAAKEQQQHKMPHNASIGANDNFENASDSSSNSNNSNSSSSSSRKSNISTLSSTLSSSHRSSLDYEAELNAHEADEEDENESEEARRALNKPRPNKNLLHVQNFLNYFGERDIATTIATKAAALADTITTTATMFGALHKMQPFNVCNMPTIPKQNPSAYNIVTATTTITTAATTTIQSPSTKPAKFTISTKFLRKSRNKLKTANLTAAAVATTTTNIANNNNQHMLQARPQQHQLIDENNAKFKDFSIDSLLNN